MADERIKFYYQDKDGNVMGATDTAPSPDDKTVAEIVVEKAQEENCFKTINGESIIGQGDIVIGGGGGDVTKYYLVSTDPTDNPEYNDLTTFLTNTIYSGYPDGEAIRMAISEYIDSSIDDLLGSRASDVFMRIVNIFNGLQIECNTPWGIVNCIITPNIEPTSENSCDFSTHSFMQDAPEIHFSLSVENDIETGDYSFVVSFYYLNAEPGNWIEIEDVKIYKVLH